MALLKLVIEKDMGSFHAAHQLPTHNGQCANLHGHSYRVQVGVSGVLQPKGPHTGMVMDFADLKAIYKERIEDILDHALILGDMPLPWVEHLVEAYAAERGINPSDVADNQEEMSVAMMGVGVGKIARLPIPVTTAECLAGWMFDQMVVGMKTKFVQIHAEIHHVRVYETSSSFAEVSRG